MAAIDAAWQGDWPAAIDAAGSPNHLAGDDARHYQALWHYILASWAVIAARAGDRGRWQTVAEIHRRRPRRSFGNPLAGRADHQRQPADQHPAARRRGPGLRGGGQHHRH